MCVFMDLYVCMYVRVFVTFTLSLSLPLSLLHVTLLTPLSIYRFKSNADLETWKTNLSAWKDYFLDYTNLYGGDVEAGHSGSHTSANNPMSSSAGHASANSGPIGRNELDSIQVDDGDEDDDKGVRPLMKVLCYI